MKLSAATTGAYAGIVLDQDPNNTQTMTLSGNAVAVTGTVYAPKAQLLLSGSAQLNATLDVDLLTLSGNAVDNGTSPPPPGPGGGAAGPQISISPVNPSAEPVLPLGDAADVSIGIEMLDGWFGWQEETPGWLAGSATPGPLALPLTAHEAEAVFAGGRVGRGDSDSGHESALFHRLDGSLLDQLAQDRIV